MASTDALPIPRKNTAFRATFPILDNTGALVNGAAGLDSEVSKDAGSPADCTNEATEIGSSGVYYLDLTSTEMNADTVAVVVKTSTTDARSTVLVLYPQEAGDVKVDVQTIAGQTATAAAGVTFPSALASPTNITAGTITNVTNLTNAPTSGDLTNAMKASVTTAATAATPTVTAGTVSDKAGYSLSGTQAFNNAGTWTGNIVGVVSTVTTLTGHVPQTGDAYLVASSRLPAALTSDGNIKADTLRVSGTAQTARDLGNALPAFAPGASGGLLRVGSNSGTVTFTNFVVSSTFSITGGTDVAGTIVGIKAKTDNLPGDPADASDIVSAFSVVTSTMGTLATGSALTSSTAAILGAIPSFPTDYQQRGVAVTLPTTAPDGYGGSFEGELTGLSEEQAAQLEKIFDFATGKRSVTNVNGVRTLTIYSPDLTSPSIRFAYDSAHLTLTPIA